MNAVRVRPVSTPLGAARRASEVRRRTAPEPEGLGSGNPTPTLLARASEVRREPHGDPGAGGDGVGGPDSQLLARASEVRREPHGDPGAGGDGEPDSQSSWLGLPQCGESRTETPERRGWGRGTRLPHGDPRSRRGWGRGPDSQSLLARASAVRREPHGDPGAGGDGVGEPDSQSLLARLPQCGESRTETPEQEGMGSGNPTPSRSWLGNRNFLARLRRATASSDSWFCFCERGAGAPLSHFPPGHAGSEQVRCHCFLRARPSATRSHSTQARERRPVTVKMQTCGNPDHPDGARGAPVSDRHRAGARNQRR